MEDRVADILDQRAHLESGTGAAVALSILMHGALMGTAVYAALHQPPPQPVSMVNIRLAQAAAPAVRPASSTPATPKIVEPKPVETPKIQEPKPEPEKPVEAKKPEKNTVPLSPFGRSTKKGAETPDVVPTPAPPASAPGVGTPADVPVGGSGVTGLEGGDFPYTIYLEGMQRKIGSNWYRPQVAGATTVIYFRIQRDGTLTDVKAVQKSGNGTFDRQAESAVRSSSPLNPLPFGYSGTYLGVHLTFR